MTRLKVIDSHTEGEPTRVVMTGFPDLHGDSMADKRLIFESEFDPWRRAIICEPRGHDVLVGALLTEPVSEDAVAGVIFFNNAGMLGMCGHGAMGVAKTMAHLGMIREGEHVLDTPVGPVKFDLRSDGEVEIENVPAYRLNSVQLKVDGQLVQGDIAYGGNWFFISHDSPIEISFPEIEALTHFCWAVRHALVDNGIRGADGAEIDHIELCTADGHRNFVLCPGGAYDRSPCGTGTSAHMACLFEDGHLAEGEEWRQESIIGSRFFGTVRKSEAGLIPTIRGRAFVTAESELYLDESDPFAWGISHFG